MSPALSIVDMMRAKNLAAKGHYSCPDLALSSDDEQHEVDSQTENRLLGDDDVLMIEDEERGG